MNDANQLSRKKRIVIIGATSAIAVQCARCWIKDNVVDLLLVGRDQKRLERVADDFKVRSPLSNIQVIQSDFLDPEKIQATVDTICRDGAVDIVLIAHGFLPKQLECQDDLRLCQQALTINVSPVLFAEGFAKHMEKNNRGTIAIIGSVAGDRGRKSNYVYGSTKGLLAYYAQGMQHRFAKSHVKVVLIKPGPTDTPMTATLKASLVKLAPVEKVAQEIVVGIEKGIPVLYVPGFWRWIMWVVARMPRFVVNRLDF